MTVTELLVDELSLFASWLLTYASISICHALASEAEDRAATRCMAVFIDRISPRLAIHFASYIVGLKDRTPPDTLWVTGL